MESIASGSCHTMFGVSFCYLHLPFRSEVVVCVTRAIQVGFRNETFTNHNRNAKFVFSPTKETRSMVAWGLAGHLACYSSG